MKTFLSAALIAAFFCATANAATAPASISWVRPSVYADNSPLPVASISGNKIVCTFTPTGGAAVPCTLAASTTTGSAQTFTSTLTYPPQGGQACFQVIATANGIDSDASSITPASCGVLPALKPGTPNNVTVTITIALNLSSATPITVAMSPPVVNTTP